MSWLQKRWTPHYLGRKVVPGTFLGRTAFPKKAFSALMVSSFASDDRNKSQRNPKRRTGTAKRMVRDSDGRANNSATGLACCRSGSEMKVGPIMDFWKRWEV